MVNSLLICPIWINLKLEFLHSIPENDDNNSDNNDEDDDEDDNEDDDDFSLKMRRS